VKKHPSKFCFESETALGIYLLKRGEGLSEGLDLRVSGGGAIGRTEMDALQSVQSWPGSPMVSPAVITGRRYFSQGADILAKGARMRVACIRHSFPA
jgi:hypothetical protein